MALEQEYGQLAQELDIWNANVKTEYEERLAAIQSKAAKIDELVDKAIDSALQNAKAESDTKTIAAIESGEYRVEIEKKFGLRSKSKSRD